MIDVGGPSMLRGAAKNFAHCAPVCRPERYGFVLDELRDDGELSLETRRALAAEAFATTAAYEAAIARWFADREAFPEHARAPAREGARPLVRREPAPARRVLRGARRRSHLLSRVEQLHGKELSFNNLNDLSAARILAREFALPACVIVKHANPCGVAIGATIEEAYEQALACDPMSAYGGVVVLNRDVDGALGARLARAVRRGPVRARVRRRRDRRAAAQKQGTRILVDRERRRVDRPSAHYKRVLGGLLVQDPDREIEDRDGWTSSCGDAGRAQWGDLVFAWRVCKHVGRTRSCSRRISQRSASAPGR